MIECLIFTLIVLLVAVVIVFIIEAVFGWIGIALPPPAGMILRLIAGLIVLLYLWRCIAPALHGAP